MENFKFVRNDIFDIGIFSEGASGFGIFVLALLTLFFFIVMSAIASVLYGKDMDKGDGFFSYLLIFIFSVVGFFIIPSSYVCVHGPALGFILGFIFYYESRKRAKMVKWWTVKNSEIDKRFQKYRKIPKFILFASMVLIVLAAIFLPQYLCPVKYYAISIGAAVLSNIISAIQFSIDPFPETEDEFISRFSSKTFTPAPPVSNAPRVYTTTSIPEIKKDSVEDVMNAFYHSGNNTEVKNVENNKTAMEEFDSLVGMTSIKNQINEMMRAVKLSKITGERIQAPHIILTGNPGTGKTTLAELIAKVFYEIGLLKSFECIKVNRSQLVGQYQGHTAIKVREKISEAIEKGCVLFIDEAYSLIQDERDSFGHEAVNEIVDAMYANHGKFVLIVAGYEDEMRTFLASNSGFEGRFDKKWHIDDYDDKELFEIAMRKFNNKRKVLDEDAKDAVEKLTKRFAMKRGTKGYSNARLVEFDLVNEAIENQRTRITHKFNLDTKDLKEIERIDPNEIERINAAYRLIIKEDIPFEENPDSKNAMEKLDAMVGMKNLKEQVRKLKNKVQNDIKRNSAEKNNINIILTGNPGTGKTTVARIIAQIFNEIGLLPEDKFIEANYAKLVSPYIGETPRLVNKACDDAMGGVLFIDEAYTLAEQSYSNTTDPGKQAIEALLDRMEKNSGQFCVIAAGYKNKMEEEFLPANDGLKRRFRIQLNFDDYLPEEMLEIFMIFIKDNKFIITDDAKSIALECFKQIYDNRTEKFGNGGSVNNLFVDVTENLANRVAVIPESEQTQEVISTIIKEDFNNIDIKKYC